MQTGTVVRRSLRYYRRSNLAVIAGIAAAVAVLAGARVVGDSVRGSLRRIALDRIGNTEVVVSAPNLFREQLAGSFGNAVPLVVLEGLVTHQSSGRRATSVTVYGVDDRFWRFQGQSGWSLENRDAGLSQPLANELGAQAGDTLLLRIEKPSDIPAESLFGRKEEAAPTIRLNLKRVGGEFSLRAQQGAVRALFVPLSRLQREIDGAGKVNTILVGGAASKPEEVLRSAFTLDDLGIRLRGFEDRDQIQMDTASGILNDALVQTATREAGDAGLLVLPVMTYMATTLRARGKEIPYSLLAAMDLAAVGIEDAGERTIAFNQWAAQDLGVRTGDRVEMEYLLWHNDGRMTTEKTELTAGPVVRLAGLAADRDLTPEYPGITDADNVSDWDPPFPMDLSRIRPRDEDYWDKYRTTPKAFLPLPVAQKLWESRWGKVTALRMTVTDRDQEAVSKGVEEMRSRLRAKLDPMAQGFAVVRLRDQNLAASQGATDFGEYFGYFSFFLVVSALMLAGLFFRLGIEQRVTEVGLLRAVGLSVREVRRLFLREGMALSAVGGLVGALGALAYGGLVVFGLGTWWVEAVGTRELSLQVTPGAVSAGILGGMLAAIAAVGLTLRGFERWSPRQLLAGVEASIPVKGSRRARVVVLVCGVIALLLAGAAAVSVAPAAGAFFGVGTLLLIGALGWMRLQLASSLRHPVAGSIGLRRLAFRNAATHPGRTILATALIASATFLLVSVEAFRRDPHGASLDPKSGTGGYPLMAESNRPIYHNPNSAEGRESLNLGNLKGVKLAAFRLRPGDDASCLNLFAPQNPRVLGAPAEFLRQGRFDFAQSEGEGGWALLEQERTDGAVPAIADANSITYVLHKKVGEEVVLGNGMRLRLVAALRDSVFQSELIISEKHFLRLFPKEQGYRVFLIEAPVGTTAEVSAVLENALADHGLDTMSTGERLAAFHRVENTFLSTFQTLGGLGLLLGTIGLAAVLFRNVLERRRELALLAAVGYSRAALERLVMTEHVRVLVTGLVIGSGAAMAAIAPVLVSRGAQFSFLGMGLLLSAVLVTGLIATWLATRAALGGRLAESLRAG